MDLHDYLWLVVVGSLAAFVYGFGTGSNDVANAFGTSVGAKTLSLRQAVLIAAVFEFVGALVLGRVSTSTIAGGIADINAFKTEPEMYAYGMVCALTISGLWQILSSYLEINTSSTHSIIGSILGFSLVYAGSDGVLWYVPDPNSFPPYKGLVPIVVSWFFSPIFCAIATASLFLILRTLVLRRTWAYQMSFWVLPPLVTFTVFVCLYFVFTKGAKKALQANSEWTDATAAWVAAVSAVGCGIIVGCLMPFLMRYANKKFDDKIKDMELDSTVAIEVVGAKDATGSMKVEGDNAGVATSEEGAKDTTAALQRSRSVRERTQDACKHGWERFVYYALYGTNVDVHQVVEDDPIIAKLHQHAEVFEPKVEYVFQYLQVFSACCVVFAHGAGEVGYMAGPLAAIWNIVQTGYITSSNTAPVWAVLIGAAGLVVGLATYGYNVVRAMGVRLAKLSPTRGFCAELCTALVIMIAAQYGLPTSSSQVITGGIIGVGLCEGIVGVNWRFFAYQFASWIGTLIITGFGTAALFSMGAFAPSVQMGKTIQFYEQRITELTNQMSSTMSATTAAYYQASNAGLIPRLPPKSVNNTVGNITTNNKNAATQIGTKVQTADPELVMGYLYNILSLYQQQTVNSMGQIEVYPTSKVCSSNTVAGIQNNSAMACPEARLVPKQYYTSWNFTV